QREAGAVGIEVELGAALGDDVPAVEQQTLKAEIRIGRRDAGEFQLLGRLYVAAGGREIFEHEAFHHRLDGADETGIEQVDGDLAGAGFLDHPDDGMNDAGEFLVDLEVNAFNRLGVFQFEQRHEQRRLAVERNVERDGALIDREVEAAGVKDIGGRQQQNAVEATLRRQRADSILHTDVKIEADRTDGLAL